MPSLAPDTNPIAPTEIEKILDHRLLTPVFQPIVDLSRAKGFGYEALIRGPVNSNLYSPIQLFQAAKGAGALAELEYACREVSCEKFSSLGGEGKLFINVSPMVLVERGFRQGMTQLILDKYNLSPNRIVIELSEQYPLDDNDLLKKATQHYRNMGFEIAIDDLGAGYSGLRVWNELRPDYVKIDRHFIDQIDKDFAKQEFVRSIQKIAEGLSCKVVAEGIENLAQLKTVQALGIHFGQGFFLGRPETYLNYALPTAMTETQKPSGEKNEYLQAGDLAETATTVSPHISFEELIEHFRNNRKLYCLPVVSDEYVVGNIARNDILELMAWPFSRDLYRKRQARDFMSTSALVVDRHTSLDDVGQKLITQDELAVSSHFIVTENGRFYGVAPTRLLLRALNETKLQNARYANPLTQLPGNLVIDQKLETWMASGKDFHVAYLDLNNFKPFNDYYGYKSGDEVIVAVAKLALENIDPNSDFVGHIGGDDFVVLFRSSDWRLRCQRIIELFDRLVPDLYDEQARQAGGISGIDRRGEKRFFPLLGLAIGVVHPELETLSSFHDIATIAADAKHSAKQHSASHLFVSHRRKPHRLSNEFLSD